MFGSVALNIHTVEDYIPLVGRETVRALRDLAEPLQGVRVLNLSSPQASGAVRSVLQSTVPLLTDLGLEAYWQQVRIPGEYMDADHNLRRALSGHPVKWSSKLEADWWQLNLSNALFFDETFDIVVVHHTASVGLHAALTQTYGSPPSGVWLWASHRDYRAALPQAWSLVRRHAEDFAGSVYPYKLFVRPDAPTAKKVVIHPGIDPLGPRARPVSRDIREMILQQRGIDVDRPILAQIVLSMREDDPLKVLETYELVRQRRPEVQLVIANLMEDGREMGRRIEELRARGKDLGGFLVLTDLDRLGNVELSALRDEATILIHQGFPRGISVELLEEMWQGRPIVSGTSAVAEAVLINKKTALLADTPAAQADAIIWLLDHPEHAAKIGNAAHETVAKNYLLTNHLAAELKLFQQVLRRNAARRTAFPKRTHR
ncbi:MAG: glycosyltransferase [Dehalococcoidia bacterium]